VIPAVLCLVCMLIAAYRWVWGKEPPLDDEEIRILRRLSDRIRSEQGPPFE